MKPNTLWRVITEIKRNKQTKRWSNEQKDLLIGPSLDTSAVSKINSEEQSDGLREWLNNMMGI